MSKYRTIESHRFLQQHMFECVVEMFLPSNDMCYIHQFVINNNRKMVRRKSICLANHKVINF